MYVHWFVVVVNFKIHFVFYNNYKFKFNSCLCTIWWFSIDIGVVCFSICFHKVSSSTSILTLYEETTPISKLIVPMENNSSSKINI